MEYYGSCLQTAPTKPHSGEKYAAMKMLKTNRFKSPMYRPPPVPLWPLLQGRATRRFWSCWRRASACPVPRGAPRTSTASCWTAGPPRPSRGPPSTRCTASWTPSTPASTSRPSRCRGRQLTPPGRCAALTRGRG